MNPIPVDSATNGALVTPLGDYAEKVSVIRRSMRCLVYSILGSVPCLGLPIAIQAASLHRQVARETGEAWRLRTVVLVWLFQFPIVLIGRSWRIMHHASAFAGIVFLIWMSILFWGQFRRTQPRLWNPGRTWLFWGGWLAWTNLVLFVQILLFALFSAIELWREGIL
jgi:hypothetical protein